MNDYDDYSKTKPNIPKDDADWSKTNYNHPAQPPASDDWGSTTPNISRDDIDFNKTYQPSGANQPKTPDWGISQDNIRVSPDDFGGSKPQDNDFGATTPYFRLPEAERAKYQNVPPTPTQEADQKREEKKAKGGIPPWLWVSGGLASMFLFALITLAVVYFFIIKNTGYEATVKGAPPGSLVSVNGAYWGTTKPDGSINLSTLKAGETKHIEIKHPNWVCEPKDIKGENGVKPEPIIARCKQVANIADECINVKNGDVEKAEKCANKALDELPAGFSVDDLLRAMNLFVINFESNKYDIPPARMAFLQKAAGYMQKLPPGVVIEIGGHTDNVGNDAANQILSDNRAKAVRDALIKFNVKPEMLVEKGYGEASPKTTNETEDGRFQNRRIEYNKR